MTMGTALLVGFLVAVVVVAVGYMPEKRERGYEAKPPDNYMPNFPGEEIAKGMVDGVESKVGAFNVAMAEMHGEEWEE